MEFEGIRLRPNQKEILAYQGGWMGVSAVPGSGKTLTLSLLAAQLIAEAGLEEDQEILVVTLVNSAVDNFYRQVGRFVKQAHLLPHMNYRVRTLHGLANDIVRERPDLVGLADNFQIVDERAADRIREDVSQAWLNAHPFALDEYLDPELDENKKDWVRRDQLPNLVRDVSLGFIRYAKDQRLTPERLREHLDQLPVPLPLAEMGSEIYADYQRALNYRGGVDFDDLIRLALDALESDGELLERLRARWPYILEDEAQDSSALQEQILRLLVGPRGNWVRVGDPNQAIYETFTTADPKHLRDFIHSPQVISQQLPESGRSTESIITLANALVDWTQSEHPFPAVRDALQAPPYVEPTRPDDPQPNPADDPTQVHPVMDKFTPQEELEAVADSLKRWVPDHPESTVAVLVPRNLRGFDVVDELKARSLEVVDSLLRSSGTTRTSAGALGNVLAYLSEPGSSVKLSRVYRVWRRADRSEEAARKRMQRTAELLRKCGRVEDFIWPRSGRDWLASLELEDRDPQTYHQLLDFRDLVQRWQGAALLPVDQLLLTLAQDLFFERAELAIAHKLAVMLRRASDSNPSWRLPELTDELVVIARNERRFLGFGEDDTGFDPQKHRGKVVVATMHKAKGLEWERVYLMAVNSYNFPSGEAFDQYIAEKWFLRDDLNLEAETLEQLEISLSTNEYDWYQEGEASHKARLDYVRERLRLLYVGITRAKKELIITWNSGRHGELRPAMPLVALQTFWEERGGQSPPEGPPDQEASE
jgi:DNA helicase-2/ATP-dependent DNA helicase PcrA